MKKINGMPYTDLEAKRANGRARQERWREKKRAAGESTHPERGENGPGAAPWIFIDTEGATDIKGVLGDPGRQYTYLLCAADGRRDTWVLYKGRPLQTREMLDWMITDLPAKNRKFGGYFLGYDWSQIFWQIDPPLLHYLYGTRGHEQRHVIWERWAIRMFAGTVDVRTGPQIQKLAGTPPPDLPEWHKMGGMNRRFWDVGKMYNSPFAKAVEDWNIIEPTESKFLQKMKQTRSEFTIDYWQAHADELIEYSLLENRLAARMQRKFDVACAQGGYPLTQWHSAGSVAKAMMTANGIKTILDSRPPLPKNPTRCASRDRYEELIARAYFGGRFEIRAPGRVNGPVHEYDLQSAYPAAYQHLPCLTHGAWKPAKQEKLHEPVGAYDLLRVNWRCHPRDTFGPFPTRSDKGYINYAHVGESHAVWGEELNAALRLWKQIKDNRLTNRQGIQIEGRWNYHTTCCCQPFDWIEAVFTERLRVGKRTAQGMSLKIGMNSLYGTTASTLGADYDPQERTFTRGWLEPRWAGWITAWTRARMLDALAASGGPRHTTIIMFATDAVYSTHPLDLKCEDRLGGWEHDCFEDGGLLVQPGVYHFHGRESSEKFKGRGVNTRDFIDHVEQFYDAWDNQAAAGAVEMTLTPRYMGLKQMLHRGKPEQAHRWVTQTRLLGFNPGHKRRLVNGEWLPPLYGWTGAWGGAYPSQSGERLAQLLALQEAGAPTRAQAAVEESISLEEQPDGGQ